MVERPKAAGFVPSQKELIEKLDRALGIDEHALEEMCREQPTLYYEVAREVAYATSRRDAAKQALEQVEAEVGISMREEARAGEKKITVDEAKAQAKVHPDYLKAAQTLLDMQYWVGEWGALEKAYHQRQRALGQMVDLYLSRYYGNIERRGDDVKTRDAETARAAMSKMRRKQQTGKDDDDAQ